ncbi:phage holin family protein [Phenylobacterium sp.]|jgi:predicted anti-sigma-YlaC factor YlaD|uniref:phage holin family protein n=1 Tax=Phenylobacterium sp. TaxID=1871053 RepID=UPI002F950324
MDMTPREDPRSIPELISALTGDLANLVRKESELVRTEVGEKLSHAGKAGGKIALGAVLLLGALMVLLQAVVILLSKVMDPFWASLIVGVLVGVAGLLLVKAAVAAFKPENMGPNRTVRQLKQDAEIVRKT